MSYSNSQDRHLKGVLNERIKSNGVNGSPPHLVEQTSDEEELNENNAEGMKKHLKILNASVFFFVFVCYLSK